MCTTTPNTNPASEVSPTTNHSELELKRTAFPRSGRTRRPAFAFGFASQPRFHPFVPAVPRLCGVCVVVCGVLGLAQVRDKFNQQMDWDKHLSKKDLRRAEREQLAFLKVQQLCGVWAAYSGSVL